MNKYLVFVFSVSFALFFFACTNKTDKVQKEESSLPKINELQSGDQLSKLTISKITEQSGQYVLIFQDEITVEGKLIYPGSLLFADPQKTIFSGELVVNNDTIDLARFEQINFSNPDKMMKFIPKDWLQDTPNGSVNLKSEYKGNVPVKVVMNEITFKTDAQNPIEGKITEVLEFNNKVNPKPAPAKKSGLLDLNEINKGDNIEGFVLHSKVYRKGSHYILDFEGNFTTSGEIRYNDFEDSWELTVDDSEVPETQIKTEFGTYPLYKILVFKNRDELLNELGQDKINKIQSGQPVRFENITVGNLSASCYFNKGRIGVGAVDLISF